MAHVRLDYRSKHTAHVRVAIAFYNCGYYHIGKEEKPKHFFNVEMHIFIKLQMFRQKVCPRWKRHPLRVALGNTVLAAFKVSNSKSLIIVSQEIVVSQEIDFQCTLISSTVTYMYTNVRTLASVH